jgi:hypothetical protein
MVMQALRRQIISGSPQERFEAVHRCQHEGAEGWELLAELASDDALDLGVRSAAAAGLAPPAPTALLQHVAARLLASDEPVLRCRALIMCARFGLRWLRPRVEALGDDPASFWEIDVEVSLAKLARATAKLLRAGVSQPDFPDWSAAAVDSETGRDESQVFRDVRASMLAMKPGEIGVTEQSFPYPVFGILMETALLEITFLVVCLADGTASYYLSDGGWTVGGGHHASVLQAADSFLAEAQRHYLAASPVTVFPATDVGMVTFWFVTADGVRRCEALESELEAGDHPLSSLYAAGHGVLSALHQVEENRDQV